MDKSNKWNRKKSLVCIAGAAALLMIFLLCGNAYGSITAQNGRLDKEKIELGDETVGESVEEKVAYADKKINEAQADGGYSSMSTKERRKLASDILSQLEQDGYITGLSYNEDGDMYSFEYIDGTLGGWCLKDFSAQDGFLPMN